MMKKEMIKMRGIRKTLAMIALVATLVGCDASNNADDPSKDHFMYQDRNVVMSDESSGAKTTVFTITDPKDKSKKIILKDFRSDVEFDDHYDKFTFEYGTKTVEMNGNGSSITINGVESPETPEITRLRNEGKFLLKELYATNSERNARCISDDMEQINDSRKQQLADDVARRDSINAIRQEQAKLDELIKSSKDFVFYGKLPFDNANYAFACKGSFSVEAKSDIIRGLDSQPYDMFDLEKLYHESTIKKLRQSSLEEMVSKVKNLGNGYVAVIKKMQTTYAGLDMDEQVLPLETSRSDSRDDSQASAPFARSERHAASNASSTEHAKLMQYRAVEKVTYEIYKAQ